MPAQIDSGRSRTTRWKTGSGRALALLFLAALGAMVSIARADNSGVETVLRVGVLSPMSGASRISGAGHRESIELAHSRLGAGLAVRKRLYRIKLVHLDYQSNDACAAARAQELLEHAELNPIALLGPINSGAAGEVLAYLREKISEEAPPLLSALATAPGLAQEGDRFFRLVFDDRTRMQQYARFIDSFDTAGRVFAVQDSVYGKGLLEGLSTYMDPTRIEHWSYNNPGSGRIEQSGPETPAPGRNLVAAEMPAQGANGEVLARRMGGACADDTAIVEMAATAGDRNSVYDNIASRLNNSGSVVMLGTTSHTVKIARRLENVQQIFLVGSNQAVFNQAPERSHTIGDPALDPYRAKSDGERLEWTRILQEFQDRQGMALDDFMPTAYEAYSVLYQALETVLLRGKCPVAEANCVRRELNETLREGTFDSLDSWRQVEFDEKGELEVSPMAPIYKIQRSASRVGKVGEQGWVQIDVQEEKGIGLGPFNITLKPHGLMRGESVELYVMDDSVANGAIVRKVPVELNADAIDVPMHFWQEAKYRVELSRPFSPSASRFRVVWTSDYPIVLITALIAIALLAYRHQTGVRGFGLRLVVGLPCAVLLLFILAYGLEWMPLELSGLSALSIPRSVLAGLIGGVGGPTLLASILERTVSRITGHATGAAPVQGQG